MSLVSAAAAVAGTAAIAAYLDARLQIRKDVKLITELKRQEKIVANAVAKKQCSLFYRFEATAQRMPATEECIWSREGCYNWKETYALALKYSQFFLSLNVKSQDIVGFYITNKPEYMFAELGCWAVGAAPATINYHLTGDALVHCVKVAGTKQLIVDWDEGCRQRVEDVRGRLEAMGVKVVILDDTTRSQISALPAVRPPDSLREWVTPASPMCLIYTSGSTGMPKACLFSITRGLQLGSGRTQSFIGLKSGPGGDRYYIPMPLYHGTGGCQAILCMMDGITLCIGKKFSTSGFWPEVRDSRATAFVYVGETARYLLAAPESPDDKNHNVRIAFGNGLRPDVWQRFVDRFGIDTVAEFFNSTEGIFGLINLSRGEYLANSVGHHGALMRFTLRDYYAAAEIDHDTGDLWRDPKTGLGRRNPLSKGGEILVAVPDEAMFGGYWNNKKATDDKFVRGLFKKDDLWYRTGDALRRTDDGHWFFMDRLGDTYRWKSENVATAEVSEALGHYPGLAEAIVYGVLVPGHDGRAGCAAIHLSPNHKPSSSFFKGLLKYSLKRLPKYAIPVFLRLQPGAAPMHNLKQNKPPLKKDGIDLDAIYGAGKGAEEAAKSEKDVMYWWPGALGLAAQMGVEEDEYVPFDRKDWDLVKGQLKTSRL